MAKTRNMDPASVQLRTEHGILGVFQRNKGIWHYRFRAPDGEKIRRSSHSHDYETAKAMGIEHQAREVQLCQSLTSPRRPPRPQDQPKPPHLWIKPGPKEQPRYLDEEHRPTLDKLQGICPPGDIAYCLRQPLVLVLAALGQRVGA